MLFGTLAGNDRFLDWELEEGESAGFIPSVCFRRSDENSRNVLVFFVCISTPPNAIYFEGLLPLDGPPPSLPPP